MGRHTDDNSNGIADYAEVNPTGLANHADPDWPGPDGFAPDRAYEFPDPGWRPESDFTGEWVDQLVDGAP